MYVRAHPCENLREDWNQDANQENLLLHKITHIRICKAALRFSTLYIVTD